MNVKLDYTVFVLLIILFTSVSVSTYAAGQSSANFVITKDVLSMGGGERSSSSFVLKDTIGQSSAIGSSSSTNFVLYGGFWGPIPASPTPTVVPTEIPTNTPTVAPTDTPIPFTPTPTTIPTPAPVPATGFMGITILLFAFGSLLVLKSRR